MANDTPEPQPVRRLTADPAKAAVVIKHGRAYDRESDLFQKFVRLAHDRASR